MNPFEHLDILYDPAFNPAHDLVDEHREYLIHKLKQAVEIHGEDITLAQYTQTTGISYSDVVRKFTRWSDLRQAAGLRPFGRRKGWSLYTKAEIFEAFQKTVAECGEHLTCFEFTRQTGISKSPIRQHFGGFLELRRQAGLTPNPRRLPDYTDEQLLQHFHNVATKLGRIPTGDEFNRLAPISMGTLYRRFGNKQHVEKKYAQYLHKLKQE